ncbi:MAG: phosphoglycerate dehydrogenase [Clostridiales bacterium]|nr:phosphoglycerate dehydrogenase [Clostridiales bacterium]
MYKIKLYNKISSIGTDLLDQNNYQWGEEIENPDGILVRSADLKKVEIPKSVRCIGRAGAGVNNIPVDECSEHGIVVFNTPGANANAVKELVICALLLSSRRIYDGISWTNSLKEADGDIASIVEKGKSQFTGPEIDGKVLGVIGLGAIGVMVANAAASLGMEVYGYDPYISIDAAWGLSKNVHRATNLKLLLQNCDYITLHVPLNDETRGMINSDLLEAAKPDIRILNFSRGELVNIPDLLPRLESGHVSCYVTDFPSKELLGQKNVLLIPHLGASTPESEENCAAMAATELINYLQFGNIRNSVNFPNAELAREGKYRLCVIHRNIPNMLSQISTFFANRGINIENMLNRSKKEYAYTIVDTNSEPDDKLISDLKEANGFLFVRVLK